MLGMQNIMAIHTSKEHRLYRLVNEYEEYQFGDISDVNSVSFNWAMAPWFHISAFYFSLLKLWLRYLSSKFKNNFHFIIGVNFLEFLKLQYSPTFCEKYMCRFQNRVHHLKFLSPPMKVLGEHALFIHALSKLQSIRSPTVKEYVNGVTLVFQMRKCIVCNSIFQSVKFLIKINKQI